MDPLARAVEVFAAINLLAVGVSHMIRPGAWRAFFETLHDRGHAGNVLNALLALGMGSIIAAFHDVWTGVPLALTLYGWASVAKGALYLAVPQIGLRGLAAGASSDTRKFVVGGAVLIALATATLLWGVGGPLA